MTIYSLSSGPGISGIAIIRVSGKETSKVLELLTNKSLPKPRVATLRKINKINTSELIDEGIILWFPGPESYTGEDMAEIHIHGGKAVILALQNEIEKLLEFCELEWDDNCLNHHKNIKTPIKTVSISQARQPVYSSSVRSSDKYKDHLKEMFENLI